jgi:hypothetical protein
VDIRSAVVVCSSLVLLCGCQLPEEKPPASPATTTVVGPGPLPPGEQAPSEEPPLPPAEAKPVEPGITATGTPTRGTLPKAVIDAKLDAARPGIQACYEAALKTQPDLRGLVSINFVVGADGRVAHVEAMDGEDALRDAATVDCVLGQIKALEFPAPHGGRVFLSYPLRLEPPKP